MRIRRISLDDEGMPELVTVELTRSEAVFLTLLTGEQNGVTSEALMPGGSDVSAELYDAFTGELFNRYYDNGVDDAARGEQP